MLTRLCLSSLLVLGLAFGPNVVHAQDAMDDATVEKSLALVPQVSARVLNYDDAMARATGAMAVCTLAVGAPEEGIALFKDAGWISQPAEEGETVFADNDKGITLVTIVNDGGSCTINTTASGTSDVMKNFFDTMDALNWPAIDWTDDGNLGCLNAPLSPELLASITGKDGACTSPDGATVYFNIPQEGA